MGWVVRDSIQAATSPIEAQAVQGAQFTYQEFKPSKNIKEATARMTGTVADRVDLPPGAKVQMVNETHSAMLEVQERFALGPAAFVGNHKKAGPRYSWNSSAAAAFDMKRDYYLGAAKAFNYDMLDAGIEVSHATKGTHYKAATKVLAERGVHFGDDFVSIFAKMDPSEYKWAIPNTPKDIAFHELGHRLHSKVMPEISGIFPNGTFAPQWGLLISRYAQTSTEELVAESFALYMQGNKSQFFRIYPPLLRLFERMDKKAK